MRLIIAGCGPHYKTRYHGFLERICEECSISLAATVDLDDKTSSVSSFFEGKVLQPDKSIFLPSSRRDCLTTQEIELALREAGVNISSVDAILICTEPKSHSVFALWAMRQGIHIFCDKPICAFQGSYSKGYFADEIDRLIHEKRASDSRYTISCERRANPGYRFLTGYLTNIIEKYGVPITSIQVHFAGGVRNSAEEYISRENHPYKYGYGVLLHSGYHYVDLLASLCKLNRSILGAEMQLDSVHTIRRAPNALSAVPNVGTVLPEKKVDLAGVSGETDLLTVGKVFFQRGFETAFSLQLTDISPSNRTKLTAMNNPYVEGGRIRQEYVVIHVGHVCTVVLSSDSLPPRDAMSPENFEVSIIESPLLSIRRETPGVRREEMLTETGELGGEFFNVYGRRSLLEEFLRGEIGPSSLESHRDTAIFLDAIMSGATS